jgi:glutathione synthase/RimK-type ligase-like ATP-grasp enzyme
MIEDDVILIITSIDDGHANAVIKHLHHSTTPFIRINTDDLLNGVSHISWQKNDLNYFVSYYNGDKEYTFTKVRSIYYRRPTKPNLSSALSHSAIYIDESWSGLHAILFTFYEARWFGHPHLDKINSSKLAQKKIADQFEFKSVTVHTPDTILSNNHSELIDFCNKYPAIIFKPIDSRGTVEANQWIPFFSEKISSEKFILEIQQQENPKINYCFLQEYIEKKQEWRITVVDDNVFGCVILSQENEQSKTDWRRVGYEEISHHGANPPQFIHDFCKAFLKSLTIHFGAFDFIETPHGEFYFLECNVNGQWLWIEECTGQKISKAIADSLRLIIS